MLTLHERLMQKSRMYSNWHQKGYSQATHWLVLLSVVLLAFALINYSVGLNLKQVFVSANVSSKETSDVPPGQVDKNTGQVIVKFKPISADKIQKVIERHGLNEKFEIAQLGLKIFRVPANKTAEEVVAKLNDEDKYSVEFAEVDKKVTMLYTPNDPQLSNQWHHTKIDSYTAWDVTNGQDVTVAILDTGVDPTITRT